MMRLNSAITGSDSSRSFQMSASMPPGRSTRAISASATGASNQWKAWATVTRSKAAAVAGVHHRHAGGGHHEHGPHGSRGFERHAAPAGGGELAGELARPRRHVEDDPADELCASGQEGDEVDGVTGPGALVDIGTTGEAGAPEIPALCHAPDPRKPPAGGGGNGQCRKGDESDKVLV